MSVFNPLITQSLSVWYENVLLSPAFSTCFTSPSPFLSITPLTRVTFFYSSICHFKSPFPFPLGLFPSFLSSSLLTFTSGFLSPSSPLSHHLNPYVFQLLPNFQLLFVVFFCFSQLHLLLLLIFSENLQTWSQLSDEVQNCANNVWICGHCRSWTWHFSPSGWDSKLVLFENCSFMVIVWSSPMRRMQFKC